MRRFTPSISRREGFTLLELLLVVAILAVIAGSLIAAYDGLEKKSAQGQAVYNMGALDSAIRTHRVVNNGFFADEWDSLLFVDNASSPTSWQGLNILSSKLKGKLGPWTLTSAGAKALTTVGITRSRYVNGANGYDNRPIPSGGTGPAIPNRVFDDQTRGWGAVVGIASAVVVAAVESGGPSGNLVPDFDGNLPTDSTRLRDIAGFDATIGHVVVALGVGNNCTLVKSTERRSAGLSEAPFYKGVSPDKYGRFIALFHVASDDGKGGGTRGNGALEAGEYFSEARFLGVIDTLGDWYDEEEAEYSGQKE